MRTRKNNGVSEAMESHLLRLHLLIGYEPIGPVGRALRARLQVGVAIRKERPGTEAEAYPDAFATRFVRRCVMTLVCALAISPLGWGADGRSEASPNQALSRWDAALQPLAGYQVGRSTNGLAQVMACLREADRDPAARLELERAFLRFLRSDATLDAKQFVCRQLNLIGSAESVPVLAGFLHQAELGEMARQALEGIPGSAVDGALLEALPKVVGRQRIGLINTLGNRRAEAAVEPLLGLVLGPDDKTAQAALDALKKIGGTNVALRLSALRSTAPASLGPRLADALLWCGDDLLERGARVQAESVFRACLVAGDPPALRAAALRGLLRVDGERNLSFALDVLADASDPLQGMAAELIRILPDPTVARLISEKVSMLPPASQVLVLRALADRGDPATLPAALELARSGDDEVSLAALQAVGALGGSKAVPLLIEFLASPSERKRASARASLSRLRDAAVDATLIEVLPGREAAIQIQLMDCLAARGATSAVPVLVKLATETAPTVQNQAWQALGTLAHGHDLSVLIGLVARMDHEASLAQAEKALAAVLSRCEDKTPFGPVLLRGYDQAGVQARGTMLRVAGQAGGDEALARTLQAWEDPRSGLNDTALRVLADWPSEGPAPHLLGIVRTTTNSVHRTLAFRGYVRMAWLAGGKSVPTALAMFQQAMKQAASPVERKLVLSSLAGLGHVEALALAQSCLSDAAVGEEAALAMVKIAGALGKTDPVRARQALRAILQQAKAPLTLKQAQDALNRLSSQIEESDSP